MDNRSSLNDYVNIIDSIEDDSKFSSVPQFVTLKGKDFKFAKARRASLEPLKQEWKQTSKREVIHTFRNENNPFRSVKINKRKELVKMDINDENLDKILATTNSLRYNLR